MVKQFLANESANERTPKYSVIDDNAQVAPSAHFASMVGADDESNAASSTQMIKYSGKI